MNHRPKDVWIFLDNAAAITRLADIHSGPGQHHAILTQNVAGEMAAMNINLHIQWVPGHTEITGNELADKLAKEGAEKPAPSYPMTSISWLKRQTRAQLLDDWLNLWDNDKRKHGSLYHGSPKMRMDGQYYSNPRKITSSLVQLRT